jgi:hypothetical protein
MGGLRKSRKPHWGQLLPRPRTEPETFWIWISGVSYFNGACDNVSRKCSTQSNAEVALLCVGSHKGSRCAIVVICLISRRLKSRSHGLGNRQPKSRNETPMLKRISHSWNSNGFQFADGNSEGKDFAFTTEILCAMLCIILKKGCQIKKYSDVLVVRVTNKTGSSSDDWIY